MAWLRLLALVDLSSQQPTVVAAAPPVQAELASRVVVSAASSQSLSRALVITADDGYGTRVTALDAALVPWELVAVTVTEYTPPSVSPVRLHGLDAALQVTVASVPSEGTAVAVYEVIAAPPLDAGAVQLTEDVVSPAVAATPVGAPGTLSGVAAVDVVAGPIPALFVAVTANVYEVPLPRPVTVHEVLVAGVGVQVAPPGDAVTV